MCSLGSVFLRGGLTDWSPGVCSESYDREIDGREEMKGRRGEGNLLFLEYSWWDGSFGLVGTYRHTV